MRQGGLLDEVMILCYVATDIERLLVVRDWTDESMGPNGKPRH